MSRKGGGGPPAGSIANRLELMELALQKQQGILNGLQGILDCNGDGLRAELKAHREYFQATRDQVDGMMNRMDRVIKLNGVQLKNNGTSWASKVEGKACEALDRLGQAEKKVTELLCAFGELDSKVASCFAKAMKDCEEAKNEMHDFNTRAFDRGEQLAALKVRIQKLEEKGKEKDEPDRKKVPNLKKRTELTSDVVAIQERLGNLARAVADNVRQSEEKDGGEEPAGEADGQQGVLREEPERAKMRHHYENCQRAASMLTGRSWSAPPPRSRLASAQHSSMVSPFTCEASAPGCGCFFAQDVQVLQAASALPAYLPSTGPSPPLYLFATDPCEGQRK